MHDRISAGRESPITDWTKKILQPCCRHLESGIVKSKGLG